MSVAPHSQISRQGKKDEESATSAETVVPPSLPVAIQLSERAASRRPTTLKVLLHEAVRDRRDQRNRASHSVRGETSKCSKKLRS